MMLVPVPRVPKFVPPPTVGSPPSLSAAISCTLAPIVTLADAVLTSTLIGSAETLTSLSSSGVMANAVVNLSAPMMSAKLRSSAELMR